MLKRTISTLACLCCCFLFVNSQDFGLGLIYEEVSCGYLEFEVEPFVDDVQISGVSFGDGSFADPSNDPFTFNHYYGVESFPYEVCIHYTVGDAEVLLTSCFEVTVSGCVEDCEQEVIASELECGVWQFEMGENWSVEFAEWSFGDGTTGFSEFDDSVSIQHEYEESGEYEVCVYYYSLPCNDVYTQCFVIYVEACEDECEQDFYFNQLDCNLVEFEIGSGQTISSAFWDFGDGSSSDGFEGHYIQHEYAQPGEYQVCLEYFATDCNQYFGECYTIIVEDCDASCEPQMIFWEEDCDTYYFEIVGLDGIAGIEWDFGDGNSEYTEETYTTHTFTEDGWYEVCPFFWSELCQEIIGDCCIEVEIACNDCPEVSMESFSCDMGVFSYEGEIDTSIYDTYCWEIWSPDGSITTYLDGDFTDIIFSLSGTYHITITNAVLCDGQETVGIDILVPSCDCTFELGYSESGCEEVYFVFSHLATEGYIDYGDGEWAEGAISDLEFHEYEESGTYTVCVEYYAEECDEWFGGCIDIYVETCEEECEFEFGYSESGCEEVYFVFSQLATEGYIDYGDGEWAEGAVSDLEFHEYEEPGIYTVCVEYFAQECGQWLGGCIDLLVEVCEEECVFEMTYEEVECSLIEFTFPEHYSQAFILLNDGQYSEDDFDHIQTFSFEESGDYFGEVEYFSEECGLWTTGEFSFTVEGCEEDCTPVVLDFEGDFGDLLNTTELFEYVIENQLGDFTIEDIVPIADLINGNGIEFCLPDGCYTYAIQNDNLLILGAIALALEDLENDEITVDVSLNILTGTLEASLGVGQDCTNSIKDVKSSSVISVYPVPVSDILNVEFTDLGWNYEIIDITGRLVTQGVNSDIRETIDVNVWSPGMYIMKATNQGETITKKFEVRN